MIKKINLKIIIPIFLIIMFVIWFLYFIAYNNKPENNYTRDFYLKNWWYGQPNTQSWIWR